MSHEALLTGRVKTLSHQRSIRAGDPITQVWQVLETVIDPELGLPLTDLGLVYEVELAEGTVRVEMTTTTPICPLGDYLAGMVRDRLLALDWTTGVDVALTHDPPWSADRLSTEARRVLGIG
jgi:metal-sulfur cluster biosynthetic enzyme